MCVKFGDWKRCGFWDSREQRAIQKRRNNKKDSIETKKTIKDSDVIGIF